MSDKRYTASDVKRIVGMARNALFYCVKTLGLIKPAQVMPKTILYDIYNLLDLMLIQNLFILGVSQKAVKLVLEGEQISGGVRPEFKIWDEVRKNRKSFEKEGRLIVIELAVDRRLYWDTQPNRWLREMFHGKPMNYAMCKSDLIPGMGKIIIDIRDIVHYVETKSGERLE